MQLNVQLRVKLPALALCLFSLLHARSAVTWALLELPTGLWLMLAFQSAGCGLAAYGLFRGRSWARCLALAIALAAFTQLNTILALVLLGHYELQGGVELASGLAQWFGCAAMLLALSGQSMRTRFEERPSSPWDWSNRLTRVVRWASITALTSVPMLLSMAAYAVYADRGHGLSLLGALGMLFSVLLLLRQRGIGLVTLLLSAATAAVGVALVLTSLDTNPCYASQDIYLSRTIAAAVALAPGLLLGLATFVVFAPRLLRGTIKS